MSVNHRRSRRQHAFFELKGSGLLVLRASPRRSFYVVVSRMGDDQYTWCWEIRRKRRPMGVKLWDSGFRSYHAAQSAGKQALEDFLNGLSMDAARKEVLP